MTFALCPVQLYGKDRKPGYRLPNVCLKKHHPRQNLIGVGILLQHELDLSIILVLPGPGNSFDTGVKIQFLVDVDHVILDGSFGHR